MGLWGETGGHLPGGGESVPLQASIDAQHGRIAWGDVKIRGPMLDHHVEEHINLCH
jgi:hypothetical protein